MAVRKICKQKGCRASPRCEHPWWFDVMYRGKRYRMPVDAFALARGATQPVTSKQEAQKVWEPQFIGEIVDVKADEAVLNDKGLPDAAKVKSFSYDPGTRSYFATGACLAPAFSIGRELIRAAGTSCSDSE